VATNQTGISIIIKAWLPVTGSFKEQIASLQMVEAAHASGDYAELLKSASVEDIKTEQKTRRVEDAPVSPMKAIADDMAAGTATFAQGETTATDETSMSAGGDAGEGRDPDAVLMDEPSAEEPAPRSRKRA